MTKRSILDQEKFWEIIKYLTLLDTKKSFQAICSELSITKPQLNSFITFLKEVSFQFEIESCSEEYFLVPLKESQGVKVKIEMSLLEWLYFQAHFPSFSTIADKPYHKELASKLAEIENENQKHDLFAPLEVLDNIYNNELNIVDISVKNPVQSTVEFIQEAIILEQTVSLDITGFQQSLNVYPRKIVYLDGCFNLIGESLKDGCLINLKFDHIVNAQVAGAKEWEVVFSAYEIDEFISSLRFISDNSKRLVLKLFSLEKFNLNVDYQFFEKPCLFTNTNGDHIWAATVEPNEKLYDWLAHIVDDVEILDPIDFKRDFIDYCERKLKKLA